jgi:hypothetical protein
LRIEKITYNSNINLFSETVNVTDIFFVQVRVGIAAIIKFPPFGTTGPETKGTVVPDLSNFMKVIYQSSNLSYIFIS